MLFSRLRSLSAPDRAPALGVHAPEPCTARILEPKTATALSARNLGTLNAKPCTRNQVPKMVMEDKEIEVRHTPKLEP